MPTSSLYTILKDILDIVRTIKCYENNLIEISYGFGAFKFRDKNHFCEHFTIEGKNFTLDVVCIGDPLEKTKSLVVGNPVAFHVKYVDYTNGSRYFVMDVYSNGEIDILTGDPNELALKLERILMMMSRSTEKVMKVLKSDVKCYENFCMIQNYI